MTTWEHVYKKWDTFQELEQSLQVELDALKIDQVKLEDAFYKDLMFGTGGIRGELGPGTNRMNIYIVRKAVNGLANYLQVSAVNVKDRGVVIAYDSRLMSKEFAEEAAKVLGFYGIRSYVFEEMKPTPLLSFAVRYLGAAAGIMITASHNPPSYNGLKMYNEDGIQLSPEEVSKLVPFINQINDELQTPFLDKNELESKELIYYLKQEVDFAYLERLKLITRMEPDTQLENKDLRIVYTPLHGVGLPLVAEGLKQLHFSDVHIVNEQAIADPLFSTVNSPNPEEREAFQMATELGSKVNAEILLATDPDADRLGVAVRNDHGDYQPLTGNQLGSLLLDYILRHNDPRIYQSPRMIKTVVTTEMGKAIADSYQVKTVETLTGFKYIGEKIHSFDSSGETFVFGFEESYGYLVSGFVREKDAIQAAVMTAEMTYYWEKQGKTLLEVLDDLYKKHGFYLEETSSIEFKGKTGTAQMRKIMDRFHHAPPIKIDGIEVEQIENYATSERKYMENGMSERMNLPKENMLKFHLENNAWFALRPSGTEPKMKYYYGVCENDHNASNEKLIQLGRAIKEMIEDVLLVHA